MQYIIKIVILRKEYSQKYYAGNFSYMFPFLKHIAFNPLNVRNVQIHYLLIFSTRSKLPKLANNANISRSQNWKCMECGYIRNFLKEDVKVPEENTELLDINSQQKTEASL